MKPIEIVDGFGSVILFLKDLYLTSLTKPARRQDIFDQIWTISMQSFLTTGFAGFFVGGIMAVQFSLQMNEFGALGFLGGLATSATIREVGPLLIAFMLAGKVGAYTSAELGTMRVTEQIDAIRCLGADPIQELILPRFFAIIVSSFFLFGIGLMMSIGGGMLIGSLVAGVTFEEYLRNIPTIVAFPSIVGGLVKCFCFSFLLATICTYRGYNTSGGAKGVGKAVVNTAVSTMIGIVFLDWFTSFLSDSIMKLWGIM